MKRRDQIEFLFDVMSVVDKYGLSISSWKRSEEYNQLIGGHPESRHLTWDALDLVKAAVDVTPPMARGICENAFGELKKKGYYGYVRAAGTRRKSGVQTKIFQIHIQRQKPRKK